MKSTLEVATVLTACGIETHSCHTYLVDNCYKLQQYLPLAVLKQSHTTNDQANFISVVATVLTACGIETKDIKQ